MLDAPEKQTAYWVYPIELAHLHDIRGIAVKLNCSASKTIDKAEIRNNLVQSLNCVVDAGFDFFYVKPSINNDSLSPMARKAADSVVNTVRKAIHLVIERVFKKMSLEDLSTTACYMDSMGITNPEEGGLSYIAFPLNEVLQSKLYLVMNKINEEPEIERYSSELVTFLSDIVHESAHYYYHLPTGLVHIGGFSKKAADLGIDTTVKGIQGLLRTVVKDISHHDIKHLPDNVDQLIVTFPVAHNVCSAVFIANK